MARGLMTYPMGGTVDGVQGDHVLLAPPFIATDADLDAHRRAPGRQAVDAAALSCHRAEPFRPNPGRHVSVHVPAHRPPF
jgi:hypothetical protein